MTTRFEPAENERGSALLMSLVLIFVMTVLGLALFDLGVVESRLVYTSQADARAFEIAQAGVERALRKLQDTYNEDLSWASGTTPLCSGGSHRGCSDGRFWPAASGYISNLSFDTGSYSVEFMQVPEQTLAIPCQESGDTSDVASPKKICRDLIFVRSTGTLNSPGGYSPTRTIQLLVQATLNPGSCLICGGLTGATATGLPINGNVKIAGSVLVGGVDGTRSLDLGGGAGQTNSYAELDSASLQRIPRLKLVCPLGRTCTSPSDLVESLGATLKVARPVDIAAVRLQGTAQLGQNGDQTYSGDGSRKGKGPLDAIRVANGCAMPCTDNFTGVTLPPSGSPNVFVDGNNITKPYQDPVAAFPLLTGSWLVFNDLYDHFVCPLGTLASSCPASPPPSPPTPGTPPTPPPAPGTAGSEFFVSRAANVMVSANCLNTTGGTGCDPIRNSLGSDTGLRDDTASFSTTVYFFGDFSDPNNPHPERYMKARICWKRSVAGMPDNSLEFGLPIPDINPGTGVPNPEPTCDAAAPSSQPILLYLPQTDPEHRGLIVERNGGPTDYNYRGSAVIVTNGLVKIEERLQTCLTSGGGSPCENAQFTANSSLTVMTWGGNSGVCAGSASCGNMILGKDRSNIDRIMGMFYAGCSAGDPGCGTTKGVLTAQKQTNISGTALGYRLCFAGGSSPCESGGNVPSFFQVLPDVNNFIARIGTPGGGSFTVGGCREAPSTCGYWAECKRTPGDALPTGLCTYTP